MLSELLLFVINNTGQQDYGNIKGNSLFTLILIWWFKIWMQKFCASFHKHIHTLSAAIPLCMYELSDYTPSNTTLGIYVYSPRYNGQHVSTRYRVIIRPIGACVMVHEKNAYVIGSNSVYICVYWPSINLYKLWAICNV
jgi:hypothetical protein